MEPALSAILPAQRIEMLKVARKVFWWGNPEDWLNQEGRFLAQVMTFGDWHDVTAALDVFGQEKFRNVLRNAPPGVFDIKSWHYWHHRFGIDPAPPLPERKL